MSTQPAVADLYRDATRAAWIGLIINLSLGAVKLVGGIIGQSFALMTDAVNSLADSFATIVVLVALRVAQRPANATFPYGHSRAEGIAASNVALIIALTALMVGWEAIHRLTQEHDVPPVWTLWIAGSNIIIKEVLYRYKTRVGRRTGSAAIIANAWDHRADALCAMAVLIGLMVVRWGGPNYLWADEVAALIVVAAILWSSVELFRRSASELMDAQADQGFVDQIRRTANDVPKVCGVEKLWVRKSGLEYFVDIHLEVAPDLTVAAGHDIGHAAKSRLLSTFPAIRDVTVHLEPYEPPDAT